MSADLGELAGGLCVCGGGGGGGHRFLTNIFHLVFFPSKLSVHLQHFKGSLRHFVEGVGMGNKRSSKKKKRSNFSYLSFISKYLYTIINAAFPQPAE